MNIFGVMRHVFFLTLTKNQILDAIVGSHPVYVMDYFGLGKVSAKVLFHYQTMLVNVAVLRSIWMINISDKCVTIAHMSSSLKGWMGTSTLSERVMVASFASFSNLRFLSAQFFSAIAAILNLLRSYNYSDFHGIHFHDVGIKAR